ncbi:MAG: 2-amino-4-hydroxy-6-hydroxymethyldihydropteridine diphosphokinase [Pirellulales bacterium]
MTTCLIALGSNLGDRAATLDAAIDALAAAPGVEVVGQSAWQLTIAVGSSRARPEFLNGAALVETSRDVKDIHSLLQQIEAQHGRERHELWGDRTLDLDLLQYGDAVVDTPTLTVPHPRMSFRRFVLEPAVEIAGEMVHPTIGWTLERLLEHLDAGADCVAILSPEDSARRELATTLSKQFGMSDCEPSAINEQLWPAASTTWLKVPNGRVPHSRLPPANPKLSILLDVATASEPGRGPTLRIAAASGADVVREAFAAIEAVWPRLGPWGGKRLQ